MTSFYLKKNFTFFLCFFLLALSTAFGQTVIKGRVLDELTQEPIIGAQVLIKGTKTAAATDVQGNFSLSITDSLPVTLEATYMGYLAKEIPVYEEEQGLDITLKTRLSVPEIVVTAVGIESSRNSISSTITEVKGTSIQNSREPNLTTALSGKVAGVQVTNSGGSPGGASQVRIRGNSSLLGNNSPLYVLDGVPIDNSVNDLLGNVTNSLSLSTPSNRAIDINPDDIESMSVLKGPAAAALYGIRAANGAIIINTKKGAHLTDKPFQVSVGYGITFDQNNRRMQPRQNNYTQGSGGRYDSTNQNNWGALIDTLVYSGPPTAFDRVGSKVMGRNSHPNGTPLQRYDNEKNFFVTGVTQNFNVNVAGKLDKASYYASLGRLYQTGTVPTTNFYRTTFRFNGDYQVTEKLKIGVGTQYTNSGADNRALGGGYPTSAARSLRNTPANFDVTNGYDKAYDEPGAYQLDPTPAKPWGASRGYSSGNGFDNPYWTLNRNPQKDQVNRFIGYLQLDYAVTPWLKATFRPGLDVYRDYRNSGFANGGAGVAKGIVNVVNFYQKNYNHDLLLTADRNLSKDLAITFILGQNYYSTDRYQVNSRGDGLIVTDLYSLSNASTVTTFDQSIRKKLFALFASANFSYKKWLFLNITGRNEWSSTLPKGNNSFFYPSIGSSFVFTEAFDLKSTYLSFGKVRATYAQVGNDVDPYSLDTYYNNTSLNNGIFQSSAQGPFNGNSTLGSGNNLYGLSYVVGNNQLKPERISSWELGTEFRFLRDRIGIDIAYYQTTSRNQIIPVSLPGSTGYRAAIQNTGEISNKGIELALTATPVQTKNFSWDLTAIYYQNRSKVVSLAPGLDNLVIGGVTVNSNAQVGQPYGVLVGTDLLRNANGDAIIDDNPTLANGTANTNYGKPIVNNVPTIIGDPNPKFNASLRNVLTYKFISLSFLLDTRYGFDLVNSPRQQMVLLGVDESTNDRGQYQVIEGVKRSNGATNDIAIEKNQALYSGVLQTAGLYVEKDIYYIKLRDINLTFQLPSSLVKKAGFSAVAVTLTGRNFLLKTNYTGNDPDLTTRAGSGNGLGTDFWTMPNTHSYGAAVQLTF